MLTFLELLQMANKGEQPDEIYYNGKAYKWTGSDYVSGKKNLGEDVCHTYSVTGLNWQAMILVKDSILDDREKRFVREALVPLGTIKVRKLVGAGVERLHYVYSSKNGSETEYVLPFFKEGTMYKGMAPGRWYTIKELLEEK